jgi:hypothetical protein
MKSYLTERWARLAPLGLVVVVLIFNAIALLPEVREALPRTNDDAMHYLFVQRANAALLAGQNPFDFWVPEIELGFPQFLYYQHLPHLVVVALYWLLLKQVSLLTLFDLVRYLLLVGFPVTVYWSMRLMDFSRPAAAIAATGASLLSADYHYGFEYESYIWLGLGMFTQLWAMHLSFLALAFFWRLLTKADSYLAATLTFSALVLSHLLYAYMMAVTVLMLYFLSLRRAVQS